MEKVYSEHSEKYLDLSDDYYEMIYNRIKKTYDNWFEGYIIPKQELKELHPYYTKHNQLRNFNREYFRVFNNTLREETEKKSLFSQLCSTVKLLKGGGWKIAGKDSISPLHSFESSFSLPREYYIDPDSFNIQLYHELYDDWHSDSFNFIQECLNNE